MIKLTKIRLINWHLFTNTTQNIENITFLTGANGTGKSTIIDALQMVLLGDTTGRNFNKAANEKNGRTLMGYLKCETGKNANGEQICLRKGAFNSYIALEFYDDFKQHSFTVGIVFDVNNNEKSNKFFYLNSEFPQHNFTNKFLIDSNEIERPLTSKELEDYVKSSYDKGDYQFFDTNLAYQNFIKERFGNLPSKYFTLFKKAVSFTPISQISDFITEFVCDVDYNIDISPMQNNIAQYKILEIEAQKLTVRVNELSEIKSAFIEYRHKIDSLGSYQYIADKISVERVKKTISEIQNKILDFRNKLNTINTAIETNKEDIDSYLQTREELSRQKLSDSNYDVSSTIMKQKDEYLKKIEHINHNKNVAYEGLKIYASKYLSKISPFVNQYESFKTTIFSESLADFFTEYFREVKKFKDLCLEIIDEVDLGTLQNDTVIEFQKAMTRLKNETNKFISSVNHESNLLNQEATEISNSLAGFSSGRKPFPQQFLAIKSEFESEFCNKFKDAQVHVYCDLIDVNDPVWRECLEAMLRNQKFNLFVNEKYFDEATIIYNKILRKYNATSTGLVDSAKLLARNPVANPDSIAKLIDTNHAGARAYTDFLIGKIKKCSNEREARESENGVLANCSGYRNYATFNLKRDLQGNNFIGTKVSQDTQFALKQSYDELQQKLSYYTDISIYLNEIANLDIINDFQLQSILNSLDSIKYIASYTVNITNLEKQLEDGNLNTINQLDQKIKDIDADIASLRSTNDSLLIQKGTINGNIERYENTELPLCEHQLETYQRKLDEYDQEKVAQIYDPFYQQMVGDSNFDSVAVNMDKRRSQIEEKISTAKRTLTNNRYTYVNKYNLSYDCQNLNSNEEFDNELDTLQNVSLPQYEQKIKDAKEKAIKEFKDDFIYKLRHNISTVIAQIEELNLALDGLKFGRDFYKFSVTPDPLYKDYYDMFMDDLLLDIGDTSAAYFEKYENSMNELFEMISDTESMTQDQKEVMAQNIQKFTDYRTYLKFDLLVTKGDDGRVTSLAHTFRTTSGGESQTPFYISILASFAQLYRVSKENDNNTIRLVIFDEAFSKMDAVRIKEACELLKSFGLQAILSTPSEKLRDLINAVDLVLVAIHDEKNGKRSYLDKYQDKYKKENPEVVENIFVSSKRKLKEEIASRRAEQKEEQEVTEEESEDTSSES